MYIYLIFFLLYPLAVFGSDFPHPATIYIFPSENKLKWETPEELAVTALKNASFSQQFGMRFIDHMALELKCDQKNQPFYLAFTFDDAAKAIKQIYEEGIGYRILFDQYKGLFESQEEIQDMIKTALESNSTDQILFLNFPISKADCLALKDKALKELKKDYHYTLFNDHPSPLATNCTKLLFDLLIKQKILDEKYLLKLMTIVYVPDMFIGSKEKKIFPQTVYLSDNKKLLWKDKLSIPYRKFNLINPEKITKKIRDISQNKSKNAYGVVLKGDLNEFMETL